MNIKEILSDSSKWTRLADARDKYGKPVGAHDEQAAQFSLIGAVFHAGDNCVTNINNIRDVIRERYPVFRHMRNVVTEFNDDDSTTFEMIREVIDAATNKKEGV